LLGERDGAIEWLDKPTTRVQVRLFT
jgi:hypothetical protein